MFENLFGRLKSIPLDKIAPQLSAYLKRKGVKARVIEYESEYSDVRGRRDFVVMTKIGCENVEIGDLTTVKTNHFNNTVYHGVLFGYVNSCTGDSGVILQHTNFARRDHHCPVPFP